MRRHANVPGQKIFETSNGRSPLEQSSDRHQTLGKRVSDDPRRFIFQPREKSLITFFQNFREILCRNSDFGGAMNF